MHHNPAEDWQALAEHYRQMDDVELRELAADFGDLTPTAQEVLRGELRNRRLPEPGAKAGDETVAQKKHESAAPEPERWVNAVDADAAVAQVEEPAEDEDDEAPREFTWKTPLCDCETMDQALQLQEALKRAGIDSWVEQPGRRGQRAAGGGCCRSAGGSTGSRGSADTPGNHGEVRAGAAGVRRAPMPGLRSGRPCTGERRSW